MRRPNDYYPTGSKLVSALLPHIDIINSKVIEPCNGNGHISKFLICKELITNDIAHDVSNGSSGWDARNHINWLNLNVDWTITNPPFNQAFRILCNAHYYSKVGVAFLLRLSFLEPTIERGEWLNKNPPNKLIVLPRYSFTQDGKTDSVTSAWMVWDRTELNYIQVSKRGG